MRSAYGRFTCYALLLTYFTGGLLATILSYLYNWNREHIGLVFFLGAFYGLFLSRYSSNLYVLQEKKETGGCISRFYKITLMLFICILFTSILMFINFKRFYYLPINYFFIISIIGFIISIQISINRILSKTEIYLTLLEIIIFSTLISASFLFLFPGPYGNDSSYHIAFIKRVIDLGNIDSYPGNYQNYPIYHILFVSTILITGIDNIKIIQFIIAIIQILFSVFLFIIIKKLFNEKVALFSTLFALLAPHLIQPRYMFFPCSFTVIFFVFIIYLLFNMKSKTVTLSSVLITVFVITVFSHPLSPAILIITIITIFVILKFIKLEAIKLSGITILLMSTFTLSWWMRSIDGTQDLFGWLISSVRNALETLDYTAVTRATLGPLYSWNDVFLYELGISILIFLGIIGAFYSLKTIVTMKKLTHNNEKILVLSIVTLLLIPVPYLLAMIYPQSLPDRWFPFVEVFVSIFAGVSVVDFTHKLSKCKLRPLAFSIPFMLIFFMITSPIVNPNNQIYAKAFSDRSVLMESEIISGNFAKSYCISDYIRGNTKYIFYIYEKTYMRDKILDPREPKTYNDGIIIIRNYDLEKGFMIPLFGAKGLLLEVVPPTEYFLEYLSMIPNKIYSSSSTTMYCN